MLITLVFAATAMARDMGVEVEPAKDSKAPSVIDPNERDPSIKRRRERSDTSKEPKQQPEPVDIKRPKLGSKYYVMPSLWRSPIALSFENPKSDKTNDVLSGGPVDYSLTRRNGLDSMEAHSFAVDDSNWDLGLYSTERSSEELGKLKWDIAGGHAAAMAGGGDHAIRYDVGAGVAHLYDEDDTDYDLTTYYHLTNFGFSHAVYSGHSIRLLTEQGDIDPGSYRFDVSPLLGKN